MFYFTCNHGLTAGAIGLKPVGTMLVKSTFTAFGYNEKLSKFIALECTKCTILKSKTKKTFWEGTPLEVPPLHT